MTEPTRLTKKDAMMIPEAKWKSTSSPVLYLGADVAVAELVAEAIEVGVEVAMIDAMWYPCRIYYPASPCQSKIRLLEKDACQPTIAQGLCCFLIAESLPCSVICEFPKEAAVDPCSLCCQNNRTRR